MKSNHSRATHVRFTDAQFERILRDVGLTQKSIPWLLKKRYFDREISPPLLDGETRKDVRRELAYLGNNINQLARLAHAGILGGIESRISEALQALIELKRRLGTGYGSR